MVTGEGAAEVGGGGRVGALWGQGLNRAGAAGLGWSWSPSVEAAARVSACVFPSVLISPVCRCHVHMGAQFLLHTCAASRVLPSSARFLLRRLLGQPLAVGQPVATGVHVTSDPEHACPWLGLTSSSLLCVGRCIAA